MLSHKYVFIIIEYTSAKYAFQIERSGIQYVVNSVNCCSPSKQLSVWGYNQLLYKCVGVIFETVEYVRVEYNCRGVMRVSPSVSLSWWRTSARPYMCPRIWRTRWRPPACCWTEAQTWTYKQRFVNRFPLLPSWPSAARGVQLSLIVFCWLTARVPASSIGAHSRNEGTAYIPWRCSLVEMEMHISKWNACMDVCMLSCLLLAAEEMD